MKRRVVIVIARVMIRGVEDVIAGGSAMDSADAVSSHVRRGMSRDRLILLRRCCRR